MQTFSCMYRVGQLVRMDGDVTGVVDHIKFSGGGVVYRVEWWNSGALQVGDFHEHRLSNADLSTVLTPAPRQRHADNDESGGDRRDGQNGVNYATFHSFKRSGKWYASGRAYLTPDFFRTFPPNRREWLIDHLPNRCYPGLSGPGRDFVWVIMPDEDHETGFPIMLMPTHEE